MHRKLSYALLISIISIIAVACGGGLSPGTTPATGPGQAALPALSELKAGAKLVETTKNGTTTYLRSGDASGDDGDLVLSSTAGSLSWGMWQLSSADALQQVTINFSTTVGNEAWLALADYSSNHWTFFGPYAVGQQLPLDPAKHDNGSGSIFVAVLVYDGNTATVSSLILAADHTNVGPTASLNTDVIGGAIPLEVALDASGSTDGDGTITEYEWDFDGDGTYDASGTEATADHTYETYGDFTAKVQVTDNDGLQDTATAGISVKATPVAALHGDPLTGVDSLDVTLDASGSSDADGSIVDYEWDFDGDGTYDASGTEATTDHTYDSYGNFSAKVQVTDNDGLQDTATVEINVKATPVADLNGDPLTGDDSLDVTFDASGSSDADGSIVGYEWDFDGDTVFNETGAEEDNQNIATPPAQTYTSGPPAEVNLLVTDNDGLTDTTSITVTVHGWATPQIPDSVDNVGEYTSLCAVDGNPAISYYDNTNDDLKYVRATNPGGTAWGTPLTPDSIGDVGQYTSLCVVDGYPAISYYDNTNDDLKYVRATDATGSTWGAPVTLDSADDVGRHTSLCIVDGNPAISYYDYTYDDLKFVRATDTSGSTWGTPLAVDTAGIDGEYTSLCVVDGNPAISYYGGGSDLMFIRATTSDGSAWGDSPQALDTVGGVGRHTSLCIVNGNPAISYQDSTNLDLKYIRATNASGSSWDSPQTLDSSTNVGYYTSLCVVDGNPAISYLDMWGVDLRYIRSTNANGSAWAAPQVIDSTGGVGYYTSLSEINGYAAISYYDSGNNDLKYVRLY